jgi:hypothetical protein
MVCLAATVAVGSTEMRWYDGKPLLHGTGFDASGKGAYYDRLPGAAKATVTPAVWSLSRDSTGMFLQVSCRLSYHSPNRVASYLQYALDAANRACHPLRLTDGVFRITDECVL